MRAASPSPDPALARGVGVYLAGVQFLFALCWVVYAAYLPQLVGQLGFRGEEARIVPWILVIDQIVFIVSDLVVGAWSDRAARVLSRLSSWMLAATVISGLAFALLPLAAAGASPAAFAALTLVWAVTSAALRAPPLTLLGRYVARPSQPALVALLALGLGLCNAAAPYLALQLKGVDPRVPFLLSALVLAAVTLGMRRAERSLAARAAGGAPGAPEHPATLADGRARVVLASCLVAAAAFQAHVFLASPALYRQHVDAAALPAWLPLFWVGFNLALWPAARWARRAPAPRMLAGGAAGAALAVAGAHLSPGLAALALAQLAAGAAWAVTLCAAFTTALALGRSGREGLLNGSLQAVLAAGALARVLIVALLAPAGSAVLAWSGTVALAFGIAAGLMAWGLRRLPGWPAP